MTPCGVAFVATLSGVPSNAIVAQGLEALRNLDHRGAVGSDPKTGDGAGMLLQIPDRFFRSEVSFELPRQGAYAVGNAFLPTDPDLAGKAKASIEQIAAEENLTVIGWRRVPTSDASLSDVTRSNMPYFEQLFVTAKGAPMMGIALDRMAYCLRRRAQHETGIYFASLSCRTIVYKGMVTTQQLPQVFPELLDERMASALVVRPLPLLDQYFPSLGTGSSLPDDCPQRRDQHRDGQPQLDAAPGRRCWPAMSSRVIWNGCSRSVRPTPRTRPRSTRWSSCCILADGRCRTRC